jgi:hypothetical protein
MKPQAFIATVTVIAVAVVTFLTSIFTSIC